MNKRIVLIDSDSLIYGVIFTKRDEKDVDNFALYKQHIDDWINNIIKRTGASYYKLFITVGSVFRHKLAVTKEYKSGRVKEKPLFFYDLRNYLINKWKAINISGFEAEDILAAYAKEITSKGLGEVITAHIDHDLKTVPGLHYDFRKDELYSMTEEEANAYFWKMVICGCQTDAVQGIPRIGKDNKIFKNGEFQPTKEYVLNLYCKHYGEYNGILRFAECYELIKLVDDLDFICTNSDPELINYNENMEIVLHEVFSEPTIEQFKDTSFDEFLNNL